jgi:glycosyltransferase involved in cell wall biosynthesis
LNQSPDILPKIAVVIPSYRVKRHILAVLTKVGSEVDKIYVVDDCCPENTGNFVLSECSDKRVQVLFNPKNQGVGGATLTGYCQALEDGMDIIVKIDGDDQMDVSLLPKFIRPIRENKADYTKGNRFYSIENLHSMPMVRLIGNSILSFMTKFSSGYWTIFDPTNGFTAISAKVAAQLPIDKIDRRYFFESDMLFRLNTIRAVVLDIPMSSHYADEQSGLKIFKTIPEFLLKHSINGSKRLLYSYFIRDFNIASLHIVVGIASLLFGVIFGVTAWWQSIASGNVASSGTVMLAAMPTLIGIQFILSFFSYDVANTPKTPISSLL